MERTDDRFETDTGKVPERDAISGLVGTRSDHTTSEAVHRIDGTESGTRPVWRLPDHLRSPDGVAQEIHEINILLTAILVGTHALYFWLNANRPNFEAANRTSLRLQRQHKQLNALVNAVRVAA